MAILKWLFPDGHSEMTSPEWPFSNDVPQNGVPKITILNWRPQMTILSWNGTPQNVPRGLTVLPPYKILSSCIN